MLRLIDVCCCRERRREERDDCRLSSVSTRVLSRPCRSYGFCYYYYLRIEEQCIICAVVSSLSPAAQHGAAQHKYLFIYLRFVHLIVDVHNMKRCWWCCKGREELLSLDEMTNQAVGQPERQAATWMPLPGQQQ